MENRNKDLIETTKAIGQAKKSLWKELEFIKHRARLHFYGARNFIYRIK